MRQTLRALTAAGKTVFISSHILPEVQQLADVIGIVDHGRLIREGRLGDLLAEGGHVRIRVTDAEREATLAKLAPMEAPTEAQPGDVAGTTWISIRIAPQRAAEVNRLLGEAGIYASAVTSGSDLETIFLSLTATAPDDATSATPQGPAPGWGERG